MIVFDKTGTLAEGRFGISRIISFDNDFDQDNISIVQLATSLKKILKSINKQ